MPERLHNLIVQRARENAPIDENNNEISPVTRFGLESNGIFQVGDGDWTYEKEAIAPLSKLFTGEKVAFFGPGGYGAFFADATPSYPLFYNAFNDESVKHVIERFQATDEDLATRLSYILGGIVRHLQATGKPERAVPAIKYAAEMVALGNEKSAEAIASAMGMYVISTEGSPEALRKDNEFEERVMVMAEAISQDPIVPKETRDLGLSQVARLRAYAKNCDDTQPFPDVQNLRGALDGFPTVGAEFHLPVQLAEKRPTIWKKLALLNMSQYQQGSSIQFCRKDRDVIEIRMNPSDYPTAIATWRYMKKHILPELDRPEENTAYFWVTLNRLDGNFTWKEDGKLLKKLRALGMLTYANSHANIPRQRSSEEVNFGDIYLGQTVRMHNGSFSYEGNWSRSLTHDNGQLSIYAGFGDNFPQLAYWLSMALANPNAIPGTIAGGPADMDENLTRPLESIKTLHDAMGLTDRERRMYGIQLHNKINRDERLKKAFDVGQEMIRLLTA